MTESNHNVEAISTQLDNITIGGGTDSRKKLKSWLGKLLKVVITDRRVIVGVFVCTDKDANIVMEDCWEYAETKDEKDDNEPRMLGLAMLPGKHIKSICVMNE